MHGTYDDDQEEEEDDTNVSLVLKVDKLWLLEKASCKVDTLLPLVPSFI